MSNINWDASRTEYDLIFQIADRAMNEIFSNSEVKEKKQNCVMDLTACHLNGCPLNLLALLSAKELDFAHDIIGIRNHINRQTGKIEHCFVPRHAC